MTDSAVETPTNQSSGSTNQRRVKRILIGTGVLLAALLVVLVIARLLVATPIVRNLVESRIEALDINGGAIEIDGFSGDLLGRFRADELVFTDTRGEAVVARELDIKWSPLALLSRSAKVDHIRAFEINVIRSPELEAGDPQPDTGESGEFPLRQIIVDELSITAITISEELAGRSAEFSADAALRYQRSGGLAVLNLTPVTGSTDNIAIDLNWSRDRLLNGTLNAQLEPDGVFATIARLPVNTGVSARFRGEGGISDWAADGSVDVNNARAVDFIGRRAQALEAEVRIIPDAAASIVPALSELTDDVVVALDVDTRERRNLPAMVTVDSDVAVVRLDAVLPSLQSPTPDAVDFNVRLDDPTRLLESNLLVDEVGLSGTVQRDSDGVLQGAGKLEVRSFAFGDTVSIDSASGDVLLTYASDVVSADLDLSTNGLVSSIEDVTGFIGTSPTLDASVTLNSSEQVLQLRTVRLSGPNNAIAATGTVDLENGPYLDLVTTLSGDGMGLTSRGYLSTANGTVSLRGTPENLSTSADLRLTAGEAVPAQLQPALAGPIDVTTDASIAGGSVSLSSLNVNASGLSLTGTGRYGDDTYAADMDLDLDAMAEQGIGTTRLDLSLSGDIDEIDANIRGRSERIAFSGYEVSALTLRGNVSGNPGDTLAGSIALSSPSAAGAPLELSTRFGYSAKRQSVRDLSFDWGTLRGEGSLSRTGSDLDGVNGQLTFTGRPPIEAVPFDSIDLTLDASNGRLMADGNLTGLTVAGFAFETATVEANGLTNDFDFTIALAGQRDVLAIRRDVALNLDGNLSQSEAGTQVTSSAQAELGELTVATRRPLTLALQDTGVSFDAALLVADGDVNVQLTPIANGRTVEASLTGVRLGPVFDLLARPDLEGLAQGEITLDLISGGVPTGRGNLRLDGIGLSGRDRPDITLLLDAIFSTDAADITADLNGVDGLQLDAEARLPSIDGRYDLDGLTVTADGAGPLQTLWAFVGMPNTQLKGAFDLSTSASGTSGLDGVTAELTVNDATFEDGTLGLFLDDIDLDAGFVNRLLTINTLDAVGREGGTVNVSGQVGLDGNASVSAELNQLTAVRRKGLSAVASGAINYSAGEGPTNQITGEITVDEARIDLAALDFGTRPPTVDVTFEDDAPVDDELEPNDPTPTELDIQIRAPRRIAVTGQGVDAELSLSADVNGTLSKPDYDARAEILRGNISLLGKRFEFTEGTVTIPGGVDDGRLNIQAERETVSLTAIAEVRGSLTGPEITFSSNPSLPDDEILSRVLFGRSPSQLSALEAAQLASALASLAGGGGGFNPTASLLDATGLDRLDVGTDATGAATVTTGKYLAEDVYLEVGSTPSGSPGVVVEWTPLDNVVVETELDPILGPKLSVDWTRDFD